MTFTFSVEYFIIGFLVGVIVQLAIIYIRRKK